MHGPMTDYKLYTILSANTIMAKVTNHFQQTKRITSTDKHYSLDSEDDLLFIILPPHTFIQGYSE